MPIGLAREKTTLVRQLGEVRNRLPHRNVVPVGPNGAKGRDEELRRRDLPHHVFEHLLTMARSPCRQPL